MRHGRSHDEREQKLTEREGSKVRGTVYGGLRQPLSGKSETAPTEQAMERERLRHQEERRSGRTAAGTHGLLRDQRAPQVDRETLREAARLADARVQASRKPHRKT